MNETADVKNRAPKTIAGVGRVLIWDSSSLWIGRDAGRGQMHAHHAIQISLALSGFVRLRSSEAAGWSDYRGAIVLPHHRHQFDGCGESVAHVFVEPETVQGRALLARYSGGAAVHSLPNEIIEPLVTLLRTAYTGSASNDVLIATSRRLVAQLCSSEDPQLTIDPRISRAIEFIRSRLNTSISLAETARVAHLSPSRFRHLFVAQTGISFRAYLLWARIGAAVSAAMDGLSWTESAQAWGFADSAHLTRTCRRMFGIAPSMLIRE